MSGRGSYRSIHTVLIDGQDYQALSPNARLVLLTLKLSLGPTGIDVLYPGPLESQTGLSSDQVMLALETLEHTDWIRREKNIVWLINGLRYEPSRSLSNKNHRQEINDHLAGLPRLPLIDAFRRYYGLDAEPSDVPAAPPIPITHGVAKGMGDGIPKHGNGNGRRKTEKRHSAPDGAASVTDAMFDRAFAAYPRRLGGNPRRDAIQAWRARIRDGEDPAAMLEGVTRYRRFAEHQGQIDTPYVMQASRFFGPSRRYAEPWDVPEDPVETALMAERRKADEDQAWLAQRAAADGVARQ